MTHTIQLKQTPLKNYLLTPNSKSTNINESAMKSEFFHKRLLFS